jgi:hypothetical protein
VARLYPACGTRNRRAAYLRTWLEQFSSQLTDTNNSRYLAGAALGHSSGSIQMKDRPLQFDGATCHPRESAFRNRPLESLARILQRFIGVNRKIAESS